jgi:hypothetical protein
MNSVKAWSKAAGASPVAAWMAAAVVVSRSNWCSTFASVGSPHFCSMNRQVRPACVYETCTWFGYSGRMKPSSRSAMGRNLPSENFCSGPGFSDTPGVGPVRHSSNTEMPSESQRGTR